MKKNIISIDYFSTYTIKVNPGVANKIEQTVNILNASGYAANNITIPWGGLQKKMELIKKLISSQADVIIIRKNPLMPFIFLILIWKRLNGKKIIVDIPTPNTTVIHELKMSDMGFLAITARIGMLVASFPWSLYPANKVLQYANESAYFSFGIKRKSQLISNGIDVASIPFRKNSPIWPANTFTMVAVGSLGQWHAFDRVIKGIANYNNSTSLQEKVNIKLIIVGDGECRQSWEKLAEELGVANCVEFTGFKTGQELTQLINLAHVAVASLGLFRIGLDIASVLKSREYTARGLPFIAAGDDIDFNPVPSFIFKVKNNDDPINITTVIDWYYFIVKNSYFPENIRYYASERLDFRKKIQDLI